MTVNLAYWHHLNAHSADDPRTRRWWSSIHKQFMPACEWCVRGEFGVPDVEPDETHYVTPARAAALLEVSVQRVHALRKRGALRSIGMTAGEYQRARARAGWDASEQGWGAGVWILREDVERCARAGLRAA